MEGKKMKKVKTTQLALFIMAALAVIVLLNSNSYAGTIDDPSNFRHLIAEGFGDPNEVPLYVYDGYGVRRSEFTVPAGKAFVITSVYIFQSTKTGPAPRDGQAYLYVTHKGERHNIMVFNQPAGQTGVYNFPVGLVIGPDSTLTVKGSYYQQWCIMDVFGYFTSK
jgi:hypothetical protein